MNNFNPINDMPSVYRCNNYNSMHHMFDFLLEQDKGFAREQAALTVIQANKTIEAFKYFLSDEFNED